MKKAKGTVNAAKAAYITEDGDLVFPPGIVPLICGGLNVVCLKGKSTAPEKTSQKTRLHSSAAPYSGKAEKEVGR